MDNEKVRIFLFAIIASVCVIGMLFYQNKANQHKPVTSTPKETVITEPTTSVPDTGQITESQATETNNTPSETNAAEATTPSQTQEQAAAQDQVTTQTNDLSPDTPNTENEKVDVKTEKFHFVFNTQGGTIDSLQFIGIPQTYDKDTLDYKLLQHNLESVGSLAIQGFDNLFTNASFQFTQTATETATTLEMTAIKKGIEIKKILEIPHNEYDFTFKIKITNLRKENLKNTLQLVGIADMEFNFEDNMALLNNQLTTLIDDEGSLISAGDMHFWSKTYGARQNLNTLHEERFIMGPGRKTSNGKHDKAKVVWAGLKNRYFTMLYKPEKDNWTVIGVDQNKETQKVELTNPVISLLPPTTEIKPNESFEDSFLVFVGPMKTSIIHSERYEKYNFVNAIDYGFMFPRFVKVFEGILNFIVNTISLPYWLSVISLTLMVRLMMFPITRRASMSQAKLQTIAPKMKELREKYKNDNRKLNEEMMKFYRKEGVNPFSSCLPMFIQIPIFFGLYYTFNLNYDVRFQSFLWIKDLAESDQLFHWGVNLPLLGQHLNLLPICYSVINFITMSNMPAAQDDMQRQQQKIMKWLFPVMMLVFFYRMPSALVLYFIVSGTWSVIEQKKIRQRLELMKAKN